MEAGTSLFVVPVLVLKLPQTEGRSDFHICFAHCSYHMQCLFFSSGCCSFALDEATIKPVFFTISSAHHVELGPEYMPNKYWRTEGRESKRDKKSDERKRLWVRNEEMLAQWGQMFWELVAGHGMKLTFYIHSFRLCVGQAKNSTFRSWQSQSHSAAATYLCIFSGNPSSSLFCNYFHWLKHNHKKGWQDSSLDKGLCFQAYDLCSFPRIYRVEGDYQLSQVVI